MAYRIHRFVFDKEEKEFEEGDRVLLEVSGPGKDIFNPLIYRSEGEISSKNLDGTYDVTFPNRHDEEMSLAVSAKHIFPTVPNRRTINQVSEDFESGRVIVWFSESKGFRREGTVEKNLLFDMAQPEKPVLEFTAPYAERVFFLTPTKVVCYPYINAGIFKEGNILDLETSISISLTPSEETEKLLATEKLFTRSSEIVRFDDEHFCSFDGLRIVVIEISTGKESFGLTLPIDKIEYRPDSNIVNVRGQIFLTTHYQLYKFSRDGLERVVVPAANRAVYGKANIGIFHTKMARINPQDEAIVEVWYCNELATTESRIFTPEVVLEIVRSLPLDPVKFRKALPALISRAKGVITNTLEKYCLKFPSLRYKFDPSKIKDFDGEELLTARIETRYQHDYECQMLVTSTGRNLGGIAHSVTDGRWNGLAEPGNTYYGNHYITKIGTDAFSGEKVRRSVLAHRLEKYLRDLCRDAFVISDKNGLDFYHTVHYTFDGKNFVERTYPENFSVDRSNRGSNKLLHESDKYFMTDGTVYSTTGYKRSVLPGFENFGHETEAMSIWEASKLPGIMTKGDDVRVRPSEQCFLTNLFSMSQGEERKVLSFVANGEKIPLLHTNGWGLVTCHDFWFENCFVVYDVDFLIIVELCHS